MCSVNLIVNNSNLRPCKFEGVFYQNKKDTYLHSTTLIWNDHHLGLFILDHAIFKYLINERNNTKKILIMIMYLKI